jgi:hypothetical protein
MDTLELEELRGAWARAVKQDHTRNEVRMKPCWFAAHVPDTGPCEGWIEGAHWIKRQEVERWVAAMLGVPLQFVKRANKIGHLSMAAPEVMERIELVQMAAYDPRNGVPGCSGAHHARFDSHRMPPLVVPRALVPDHVTEFVTDLGLESALERKCPDA